MARESNNHEANLNYTESGISNGLDFNRWRLLKNILSQYITNKDMRYAITNTRFWGSNEIFSDLFLVTHILRNSYITLEVRFDDSCAMYLPKNLGLRKRLTWTCAIESKIDSHMELLEDNEHCKVIGLILHENVINLDFCHSPMAWLRKCVELATNYQALGLEKDIFLKGINHAISNSQFQEWNSFKADIGCMFLDKYVLKINIRNTTNKEISHDQRHMHEGNGCANCCACNLKSDLLTMILSILFHLESPHEFKGFEDLELIFANKRWTFYFLSTYRKKCD